MDSSKLVRTVFRTLAVAGTCFLLSNQARAEITLAKDGGWTVFTDGRMSAFLSYVNGDAIPPQPQDPAYPARQLQGPQGGSGKTVHSDAEGTEKGHAESMRVRSGFTGNVFGFGVRKPLAGDTELKAYLHMHAVIEPPNRRKYEFIHTEWREAYFQLSSPTWGSFWAGRSGSLYSRGATEITNLYGFNYALGVPADVENIGPGVGHIGYGVLANNFAPGFVYTTPSLAGIRLSAGIFDPNSLPGIYDRTKYVRPEAELTYDFSNPSFLVHLFANGTVQQVYVQTGKHSEQIWGVGYGARIEVGPAHLGIASHYGKGLGLDFAIQPSTVTAAEAPEQNLELRTFDGYYAQFQLALGKLDINLGAGITRVYLLESDKVDVINDDSDPTTPSRNDIDNDGDPATPVGNDDANPGAADSDPIGYNNYKSQMGLSAVIVYHATENIHVALDVFRAQNDWYMADLKQVLYFVNVGPTVQW